MLNEDTKIELELSGEIDNKQQENLSEGSNKTVFDKMSLPVPINLTQPAVKEWFGRRKASIRPAGVFFNTANFQVITSRKEAKSDKSDSFTLSRHMIVCFCH